MRAVQILVDGFAISSLYGLAAVGFSLIFGVSGVLNLAHGGIMVVAAIIGWAAAGVDFAAALHFAAADAWEALVTFDRHLITTAE